MERPRVRRVERSAPFDDYPATASTRSGIATAVERWLAMFGNHAPRRSLRASWIC